MKIMYVAPRFHTNQVPIVKYLLAEGHKVQFVVQRIEQSEDKESIEPIVCRPNFFYKLIENFKCKGKSAVWKENYRLAHFIPSFRDLFRIISKNRPDILIYREPCSFSFIAYIIAILLCIPNKILYTQSPCQRPDNTLKRRIIIGMRKLLFGSRIYSPVYVSCAGYLKYTLYAQGIKFIPFVMDFNKDLYHRTYTKGGKINIVDIGKYRDYKDHYVLIKALALLPEEYRSIFKVSIVGQCVKDDELKYFHTLNAYINNNNLASIVSLYKNVPFSEMNEVYLRNDVFILTSKREFASIAVLEAMKFGLVCISTDRNGTATYINPKFGYLFKAHDEESLKEVLCHLVHKKNDIWNMGKKTFQYAEKHYSPVAYFSALSELINSKV